ncbi:MAG: DUF3576 domain-containing protein [Pseudomonadota bacterium]
MTRYAALISLILPIGLAACASDGRWAAKEDDAISKDIGRAPQVRDRNQESLFGDGGITFGTGSTGGTGTTIASGLFGEDSERAEGIPVNKYLWRASLDTLSFLPISSTDPFTGVIATDWGATPDAPGERFKVTSYVVSSELQASSLRVAVFREMLNDENVWAPAAVDPTTARRIEDAILTRARQIRLAEVEAQEAS